MTRGTRTRSAGGQRVAGAPGRAALLGGLTWLALIPAAELQRRSLLSYDAYNRLLVVPLVLFAVALSRAARAARGRARTERVGLAVAATGAGLLVVGNVIEFYGVLLQDAPNVYAAHQVGADEHWVGSDVGWVVFGTGMLVLLLGGLVTAVGLGAGTPRWLRAFAATLGAGVLAGNLFGLAPALVSVPALGASGAAWIACGRHLSRRADLPPARADAAPAP